MFEQGVIAGAGNHCGPQAGFWGVLSLKVGLCPHGVAALSAAVATVYMLYTNASAHLLEYDREKLPDHQRNFHFKNRFGRGGVGMGLGAFHLEKHWRKSLHPKFAHRIGFYSGAVRVKVCATDVQPLKKVPLSNGHAMGREEMALSYRLRRTEGGLWLPRWVQCRSWIEGRPRMHAVEDDPRWPV